MSHVHSCVRSRSLVALSLPVLLTLVACGGDGPTGTDGGGPGLAFVTQPSDATAGEALSPAVEVEVQDASGNRDTGSSASVTVALEDNPGGATLMGTTTVDATEGVATFEDLTVEAAAEGYTLEATASDLEADVSASFRITAAAAVQLGFPTPPSDAEGQEPIGPAVEVAVQDEFGNAVTSSSASITVALAADPTDGEATLSGTTTVAASDGVATFDDLSLDLPADGYTLEATASELPAVTSDPFAVHLTFVQVSAGDTHTCGVTTAEYAYCWGDNGHGQLGDGSTTNRSAPVPVAGGLSFVRVTAGSSFTCGVTTGDEAFCWGFNFAGQLGNGDDSGADRLTPAAVSTTEAFEQVSAGVNHTCGVTTADEAYCWGDNGHGQVGDGTSGNVRHEPVAVSTAEAFAQVSAGGNHTCGVTTADEPFCWGDNNQGEVGDGTSGNERHEPVAVSTAEAFAQVSAGPRHSCGVTTADQAFCWGFNSFGQLGDRSTDGTSTPVAVAGGLTFAQVSAGGDHTCGVTTADEPFCWGNNREGQLGDGTSGNERHEPVAVSTAEAFAQVSAGGDHTCGVTTGNVAYCWGRGDNDQLGDGMSTDSSTPVRVVQ